MKKNMLLSILLLSLMACDPAIDSRTNKEIIVQSQCLNFGTTFTKPLPFYIVEKDAYGRELIVLPDIGINNIITNENIKLSDCFMIRQKIKYKEGLIYFYPYVGSYIDTKQDVLYLDQFNEKEILNSPEIMELKEKNDWNKKLDLSKCIRKKINDNLDNTYHCLEVKNLLLQEYLGIEGYSVQISFSDIDKNGLELYAVSLSKNKNDETEIALATLYDNIAQTISYKKIDFKSDTYMKALEEYKINSGWEYDYCTD